MATYLYRLGGWAFEHRWKTLGMWLLVLVAVIGSAVAFKGKTNDEFSVPGTESQQAQDLLHEKFPGAGGASARVVFEAPAGERLTDPENKAAVMESVERAACLRALLQMGATDHQCLQPYRLRCGSKLERYVVLLACARSELEKSERLSDEFAAPLAELADVVQDAGAIANARAG